MAEVTDLLKGVPDADLPQILKIARELEAREQENAALSMQLYESQMRVANSSNMILALFGGNQGGKSTTGALRTAWDATGIYPSWFTGPRTTRPADIWVIGETNTTTRDTCQRKLLGDLDTFEGGFIPKRLHVGRPSTRQNIPKAVDTIRVRHVSGGASTITFKSYEQGREALASWTGDRVWVDEEPPFDCYEELVMRILARKGQMILTFTPLKGKTKLVKLLLAAPDDVVCKDFLGWDQAKHLDESQKKAIISMYMSQPGQLKARMTGHPEVNNGLVYPFSLKDILYNTGDIPTPSHAPRLGGMDVGWRHPTAANAGWVDPDSGAKYIYGNYRQSEKPPVYHHAQLLTWGADLRFEIDPASNAGDKASGEKILEMFWEEAHGPDWRDISEGERKYLKAINPVSAGIQQTYSDFYNGLLFINAALKPLIEELEGYAWDDDGLKPVKEDDDLMDAVRYFEMGVAAGHARPLGMGAPRYHSMFQPTIEAPPPWRPKMKGR